MIIDFRLYKKYDIEVTDIAKRLMDYGFHAPTVSFPVAGTLMIEPTESESKQELDYFCEAMISIRKEIDEVISGNIDIQSSVLRNAPHTIDLAVSDDWKFSYSREKAVFPLKWVRIESFGLLLGVLMMRLEIAILFVLVHLFLIMKARFNVELFIVICFNFAIFAFLINI